MKTFTTRNARPLAAAVAGAPKSSSNPAHTLGVFAAIGLLVGCVLIGAARASPGAVSAGVRATLAGSHHRVWDVVGGWSPDGRAVVFARLVNGRTLLMVVNVGSGTTRTLAMLPGDVERNPTPAFSRDGRYVGVVVAYRLYIVDRRGRTVLGGLPGVTEFEFSPTGRAVSITTGRYRPSEPSAHSVATVDLESRRLRELVAGRPTAYGGEWAPGGEWISFFRRDRPGGPSCDLYVIRPGGRDMHLLTSDVCDTVGWSPDGTRLALYRSAVYEIYAFRRDGQLGRLLRRLPDTFATAGWTRSGRFVTVERESRLGRVLQNHESHGAFLSPDGRRVVFSSTWACRNRNVRLKNVRLWIGDVTTGRVRRLTRGC